MKNVCKIVKKLFGFKYQIDNLVYRRLFYEYCTTHKWSYLTNIVSFKVYKYKKKTIIEIETYKPGILIGKAGRFINGATNYIENETKKTIKIYVKECKLWSNLYIIPLKK